jgi:hypothetical protein
VVVAESKNPLPYTQTEVANGLLGEGATADKLSKHTLFPLKHWVSWVIIEKLAIGLLYTVMEIGAEVMGEGAPAPAKITLTKGE